MSANEFSDPDAPGADTSRGLDGDLRLATAVLLAVVGLVGVDLVLDGRSGADPAHLVLEGILMLLAAVAAGRLWLRLRRTRTRVRALSIDVDRAREDAERWRAEAAELLEGLGRTIGRQFDRWQLTPAERSVALLLLKGLSHAEAARVRGTSERTVRDQAGSVYQKADITGRAELSAFFLEDLLVPPAPDDTD